MCAACLYTVQYYLIFLASDDECSLLSTSSNTNLWPLETNLRHYTHVTRNAKNSGCSDVIELKEIRYESCHKESTLGLYSIHTNVILSGERHHSMPTFILRPYNILHVMISLFKISIHISVMTNTLKHTLKSFMLRLIQFSLLFRNSSN